MPELEYASMALRSPCTPATLTVHRALIFDVYGTLIDWESAIHEALVPVFPDASREEILRRYASVEGHLQTQFQRTPYTRILELAHRQLATGVAGGPRGEQRGSTSGEVETPTPDAARRFGMSIQDWKPFPDTLDALHRLKKHVALVVLSNVDDESFAHTHAALCSPHHPGSAYPTLTPDSPFSLVLTAQQVGAYKPNPVMLASALKQLSSHPDPSLPSNPCVRVDPSEVLVVANSIHHDIVPAMQRGLRSVWISRYGVNVIGNESGVAGSVDDGECPYTWRYDTLGEMTDAMENEVHKNS